ncbi:MAG: UDP-glucose 4-epimerase GalE [Candidatus Aureabacteria bacterium]|nr:UDP-glucose 4-epimerase GalE [Candidatus Auribacterota bacterium]
MKKKKILITGGAGYIGSHMVSYLKEKGMQPVVFDNLSTGFSDLLTDDIELIEGDLQNINDIKRVFEKYSIDKIMHFAASSIVSESVANPLDYYRNNVLGCINLLNEAIKNSIKHFIFSSTAAVYGEPEKIPIKEDSHLMPSSPYGRSKLMMEYILSDLSRIHGFSYAALRYFNASGAEPNGIIGEKHAKETHLIPLILKTAIGDLEKISIYGNDYPTMDGTCIRDYIHVVDICEAHYLVLKAMESGDPGGVFNLGNNKGYSVKEIIDAAQKITGKEIPSEICERRLGDPAKLIADYEKINRSFGWKPKYNLENIIETAWNFTLKEHEKNVLNRKKEK